MRIAGGAAGGDLYFRGSSREGRVETPLPRLDALLTPSGRIAAPLIRQPYALRDKHLELRRRWVELEAGNREQFVDAKE